MPNEVFVGQKDINELQRRVKYETNVKDTIHLGQVLKAEKLYVDKKRDLLFCRCWVQSPQSACRHVNGVCSLISIINYLGCKTWRNHEENQDFFWLIIDLRWIQIDKFLKFCCILANTSNITSEFREAQPQEISISERLMKANNGQQWPMKTNKGQQWPMKASESQQRPIKANPETTLHCKYISRNYYDIS